MIWFFGFTATIFGSVFYAGLNSKKLFYTEQWRNRREPQLEVDSDKVFPYILSTILIALTWPVSIPAFGLFKLGKKFSKEK